MDRCIHAHLMQRFELRLINIPDSWQCGYALKDCQGYDEECERYADDNQNPH
jgi:hypothetical protein